MASGGVAGAAAIRVDYPRPALDDRREASNVHPMHPLKSPVFALAGAALLAGAFPEVPNPSGLRAAGAELIASAEPGWPQFRGPRRDGISDERGLLEAWPETGPRLLWKTGGLGKGFSSPVIAGGRLFITGDFGEEVRVLAFDLEGKPLWSVRNGDAWLNQYQGARSSVAVRDGRVYHQNAHGRVVCLDAATGAERWAVDLLKRYGGDNITWGLSECVLVDDRAVYATAGGRDALLVAFDRLTGSELWRSEPLPVAGAEGGVDHAAYASPILVRFAGRRLLIGTSLRNLYCADADTGKLQWTRPRPTSYSVLAMMPVLVGDAVFMSAPHGPPGRLHRLIAPRAAGEPVGVEDLGPIRSIPARAGSCTWPAGFTVPTTPRGAVGPRSMPRRAKPFSRPPTSSKAHRFSRMAAFMR